VIPRSFSNDVATHSHRTSHSVTRGASPYRTVKGRTSYFFHAPEYQQTMTDFQLLDFTSPLPPGSPSIRPVDSCLRGFSYSSPLLDFSNLPVTIDLTIEQDPRDSTPRSVSRSPGRVDHSPSPDPASSISDNASSHLDRFSDSERESRYRTPPSRQREWPSPNPPPRKKRVRQEIKMRPKFGSQGGVF
jgi:hypothetical protein